MLDEGFLTVKEFQEQSHVEISHLRCLKVLKLTKESLNRWHGSKVYRINLEGICILY